MRRKSKIAGVVAVVLAAAMAIQSPAVMAAGTNYGTEIGGGKTMEFTKYLVMDKEATIPPKMDFKYHITEGKHKTYSVGGKEFEVLAGVQPGSVKLSAVDSSEAGTMSFLISDNTKAKSDANTMIKDYDSATEKYIEKNMTVDFSGVTFPEPGVYRYILTEEAENRSVVNDEDLTRVIDVYVYDTSSGADKKLSIEAFVLHSSEDDEPVLKSGAEYGTTGAYPDKKEQGLTNNYVTSNLTFRKEVTGNQASKDKYFKFTVNLTAGINGDKVSCNLANADATTKANAATLDSYELKTNPTELTFDEHGSASGTFYLMHGQEITIEGLPVDVSYTVTEEPEDYKSEGAAIESYKDATNGKTTLDKDLKTSYLNTRAGNVPTGIAMAAGPFLILVLASMTGMVILSMQKRRKKASGN